MREHFFGPPALFTARSQHAEDLGKLRAHRQIQRLAGRQPAQKPLVVEFREPALPGDAAKRPLDQPSEGGIVASGISLPLFYFPGPWLLPGPHVDAA